MCTTPHASFMICCDCCHEWYHGECVGVSQSQEHTNSNYICPLCVPSSNSQYIQWPLPAPTPASFQWGNLSGSGFCDAISLAYDEIVHCKRNLFQVPSGSSGKALVLENSRLYWAYADCCSLESVALKACSVLVALALQKPSRTSKSKDHVAHLNRRLALWKEGSVSSLLDKGRCKSETS